jgi:hypothetical protein
MQGFSVTRVLILIVLHPISFTVLLLATVIRIGKDRDW